MGTVIPFPLDRVRPRRVCQPIPDWNAVRQIAWGVLACTGPRCKRRVIVPGTEHFVFSNQRGELRRRCVECVGEGL